MLSNSLRQNTPAPDDATLDTEISPSLESSSSTPPPTKQDLQQKLGRPTLAAPSFSEFLLWNQTTAPHSSLNPNESILPAEITEITAEEFRRSIDDAAQSAVHILALKIPQHCKRKAEELAAAIHSSKKSWEETGVIPDEEDIKISNPPNNAPSTRKKSSQLMTTDITQLWFQLQSYSIC
ncbi:hypothetical protein PTTG_29368 [Puccinia triticina 1-1 BBBD Race 1]|uniref:Uncharacterized protein n=1 Tax=Puccinia triticina (isolate 1-1 / race 1 (BBBD)) TaxID=630390 RepID=A0A180G4M6_PUCT1|nr:hypothetical protein PTTG_29368 [Puccinia triticina 1-1 BBBD Race 1]